MVTNAPYKAVQTKKLIGRDAELRAIRRTIGANGDPTRILMLVGAGGIGKTRLLEEAQKFAKQQDARPVIIDLYYSAQHSNSGIEAKIRSELDPGSREFKTYHSLREEFQAMRQQQAPAGLLEDMRSRLTEAFINDFNQLASKQRVLLAFDTTELIEFERETVQSIGQAQSITVEVKSWLVTVIPQLQNTAVILSGRGPRAERPDDPRHLLWELFRKTFEEQSALGNLEVDECQLSPFTLEESEAYLTEIARTVRGFSRKDAEEIESAVKGIGSALLHTISEGYPIRLGLLVDLMVRGSDLSLFQNDPPVGWKDAAAQVINEIIATLSDDDTDAPQVLDYLAITRRGLDPDLLNALEPTWDVETCARRLDSMRSLSFVKLRADENDPRVFLHDEMYEILNEYLVIPQRSRFVTLFEKLAGHYRGLKTDDLPDMERREVLLSELHYSLYADPLKGYRLYVQRSEAAIKAHETSFDMQLRDEMLRFFDQPENAERARLQELTVFEIERDSAVRWVKRHNARASYETAIQVAETILSYGPENYRSLLPKQLRRDSQTSSSVRQEALKLFDTDDPIFWGSLMTYYGEALTFAERYDEASTAFEKVFGLLKQADKHGSLGAEMSDSIVEDTPDWWQVRILGWAHNLLAYVYRRQRRYHISLRHSHRARHYYRLTNGVLDELADVLNDGAYTYALLGDVDMAERWIEHALRIRREIQSKYPLALSLNTRGLIYLLGDQPRRAVAACADAEKLFSQIGEQRGQIMALTALGQANRALANTWRDADAIGHEEAAHFYNKAEEWLVEATRILNKASQQQQERSRGLSVYSELGSVYRDWSLLDKDSGNLKSAERKRQSALDQYEPLLDEIEATRPVEFAEICEDVADLYLRWGDFEQAQALLDRGEAVIPPGYRLVAGVQLPLEDEQIDTFWQIMGKIYRARTSMLFAQVPPAGKLDNEQEEVVFEAVRLSALAVACFLNFSRRTSMHKGMFKLIYSRLTRYTPDFLQKCRQIVVETQAQYGLDLGVLLREMDEMLGLRGEF
jgi:tetratricopeptide (TPR) repeat protein